ncbi:MAG: uracil-DNA glycosylase [Gammaproteobacteria bacterium]|nr:uracil-DNA glycosylase [Gammaproteobacteria bacterium]
MADAFDPGCRRCLRLSAYLDEVKADYPGYHAAPVPPFGDPQARLLILGLAPGLHGANASGRPFTGDFAGIILYQTLFQYGFASAPESLSANDGLQLLDCRISNAVKCLPPQNKPLTLEVVTCNRFLRSELAQLPPSALVISLGRIAHDAVLRALGCKLADYRFGHNQLHRPNPQLRLLDSYHCSRYNTQTGRLTPAMFAAVFQRARKLLAEE